MDIKGQVTRGGTLGDWDQRKTTGEFKGSPEGMHVSTAVEFRAEGDLADLLTNPDRLAEFIKPGDNALMIVNRLMDMATVQQPGWLGPLASVFSVGGSGPLHFNFLAYDND